MIINPESYRDRRARDWWPHRPATPVLLQGSQLPNHGQIWLPWHVNVKDKHRSSPVAWVCCMGQHCDHNLWLDSLFHSSLAALGAILWSLLSQLATVSLKMSIHLQIQVFLHTDALAYWKAYFIGPALLSEYPFRERNECTFGIFFSVRVFNWQLEGNFLF